MRCSYSRNKNLVDTLLENSSCFKTFNFINLNVSTFYPSYNYFVTVTKLLRNHSKCTFTSLERFGKKRPMNMCIAEDVTS